MSILDSIRERIANTPGVHVGVVDWESGPEIIAGYTHLPKRQQLIKWAQDQGWFVEYDRDLMVIAISRNPIKK
jgi:hypothetical protein